MMVLLRLWAKLTGQKVVFLLDHDGEITVSLANKTPFGWIARRNGRAVLLQEDGTTKGVCYTKQWKESDK